jgi:hypothetical protein
VYLLDIFNNKVVFVIKKKTNFNNMDDFVKVGFVQ